MRPLRALPFVPLAVALALAAGACGDKSLEQRKAEDRAEVDARFGHLPPEQRPLTEAEKIERLIELVRESGHTFIRNGQEHDSKEAAEHLQMKLEHAGDRVRTAEDFIAGIATRSSMSGQLYQLRTTEGREYATRDWLVAQLRTMEKPIAPTDQRTDGQAPTTPGPEPEVVTTIDVDYALKVVEDSGLAFVSTREEGDPTTYTSGEFARMLRRKTQWLGPDLKELEPWLEEIASRSFKTDRPYQVRLENGELQDFRPWLDRKLREAGRPAEGEG